MGKFQNRAQLEGVCDSISINHHSRQSSDYEGDIAFVEMQCLNL